MDHILFVVILLICQWALGLLPLFKKIIFNWRITALQQCVDFCHTSIWISHRHTYIHPFPLMSPSYCFHLLPVVNNAAMNRGVQISVGYLLTILWGLCPEAELLGHMVILCLIFWGATILLFTEPMLTFPPAMHEDSIFSTISSTLVIFCFLGSSHPNGYTVGSYCGFCTTFTVPRNQAFSQIQP